MLVPKRAPRRLELVPVGPVEGAVLDWLAGELSARLETPVHRCAPLPLDPRWRDEERGQFSSNHIVDALLAALPQPETDPPARWLLGVAEVDLFTPGRPFVFGEATLGGCCALLSLARLRTPGGDDSLLRLRVLKEALHELGHVAGRDHCSNAGCVMTESADLGDVDGKGCEYCALCSTALLRSAEARGG